MNDARFIRLNEPGGAFHESLLLGNGHMGQAVYGQPAQETVGLSHIAFYSGAPDRDDGNPAAPEHFRKAREAAARGDYARAGEEIERFMGRKENYGTSLPVGFLRIEQALENVREYERALDLERGVLTVRFTHDGKRQTRTYFCSHPENAFVVHATDEAAMDARVCVDGENCAVFAAAGGLLVDAHAFERTHSDGTCGTHLIAFLAVDAGEGNVSWEKGALRISGTREWMLTMRMESDYVLNETAARPTDEVWREQARKKLTAAPGELARYAVWLKAHADDFAAQMGRAEVELGGDDAAEYAARLFCLGRYLTVSAARTDSELPMSLQGVWNDNVACRIGWTCDMHLDINTQMNYWLCEQTGLSASHRPLFRWMEARLIPHGRRSAARHYGLPGWAGELVSNAWGYAQPYWNRSLAPCPACGAWQALDYMTHFRRTGDRVFLREHALPVLAEQAEFLLAYLSEDGSGTLASGPSISPENAFLPPNDRRRFHSLSPTFEISVIRALLKDYLEACAELACPPDENQRRAQAALERLPAPRVRADGTLAEWAHELPASDPQHRHMSHLVGLYPLHEIDPETTPSLARAAEKSIRARLSPYENWEDTGWARNMLTLYAARLGDGETAAWNLREMRDRLTYPNFMVMHPPTRGAQSFAPVWELDGNTGAASAVAEMLLQSRPGEIHALPALPKAWAKGRFRGLMADGAVSVSAQWAETGRVMITLNSRRTQTIALRVAGGPQTECFIKENEPFFIERTMGKDL